jgi:DNA repair protein RecO (recombination protein O)
LPPIRAEGFVLRSQPLGEADKIVTFLTREEGKLRALAKSARKSRRRFGSSLEPWSRVSVALFERESTDLARLDACDLLESAFRLQEDFDTACLLAYLSEVSDLFARDRQPEPHYFRLLESLLRALREGLARPVARRYFEVWTLRLHGLLPELSRCEDCGAALGARGLVVDVVSGGAFCPRCARPGGGRGPGEGVWGGACWPRGARPGAGRAPLKAAGAGMLEKILRCHPSELARERHDAAGLGEVGHLASSALAAFAQTRFRSERFLTSPHKAAS